MDTLEDMELKIEDCRGQCYDGANRHAWGKKWGCEENKIESIPKCLYTHCYDHSLNLCVKDVCGKVSCLKDVFDVTREICKLVKTGHPSETQCWRNLRMKSGNNEKSVPAFCPTRWTVQGMTLKPIRDNHNELTGFVGELS